MALEFLGDLFTGEAATPSVGLGDGLGSFLNTFNPLAWFQQGQARDENRQVRADDIDRQERWLERNSIRGRISEGTAMGLSKLASAADRDWETKQEG